jgi:hypothetical protein
VTVETRTAVVPATKTVADVLRHAALIIEERGWHNDQPSVYQTRQGTVCMIGAVASATGLSDPDIDPWPTVVDAVREFLRDRLRDVSCAEEWNDAPGRTAPEVTVALRAAADAWEADQ